MSNEPLKITLTNSLKEIAMVAERIDEFCAARSLATDIAFAVNLSVDELLTNTISYGYEDPEQPHKIHITVRMDGTDIVIEITDDALPFEPSSAPDPDLDASLADRAIGGLGVFLVGQMMDKFEYKRDEDEGINVVTLVKHTKTAA